MASPPLLLVERSYVVRHVRVFLVVPSRGYVTLLTLYTVFSVGTAFMFI